MARSVLGNLALLVSLLGATGCHCCNDCEVTGYCVPEIKKEKIVKEGWDVECKQICIPPIHCPLSNSCELKCGKVIAVRRLVADEIECGEECIVEYKLIDPCAKKEPAEEDGEKEEKPKDSAPVEAPKPLDPPFPEDRKPSGKQETPKAKPEAVEAAAMTPCAEWSARRAEFQASYETPQTK